MPRNTTLSLFDDEGCRLYIDQTERLALIWAAARTANRLHRTLVLTLLHTGCRISEALELTPSRIRISEKAIVFRSLKKRSEKPVWRIVPVPAYLIHDLAQTFGLRGGDAAISERRLWPVTRNTATNWIKTMMMKAGIVPGPHRTPKGLRHGFGVNAVLTNTPLTQIQDYMGHADIKTTKIYLQVRGAEERRIARRMWRVSPLHWKGWMPVLIIVSGGAFDRLIRYLQCRVTMKRKRD